ncbi:hypothetical protein ACK36K_08375 [Aeromonas veronii]
MFDHAKAFRDAKLLPPEKVERTRCIVSAAITEGKASDALESIAKEAPQAPSVMNLAQGEDPMPSEGTK